MNQTTRKERAMRHTPKIVTERLNVFAFDITASDVCCAPRKLFVAYHRDEDQPEHVVTATVMEATGDAAPAYLDWIETNTRCRRKGFATELMRAVEKHMGCEISMDGATEAGDAFCEAFTATK